MEEKFYLTELFEIYGDLLTDNQREVFEMHCILDFSLSEIAEEKGVTRQNVSDALKNAKEKLTFFENALKIKEKQDAILSLLNSGKDKENAEKIKAIIGR